MGIVIKKRVSLAFLGKEYVDSFLILSAIPVAEYEAMEKDKKTVKQVVIEHFMSGAIQQDSSKLDITKDNLQELPGEVFVEAFKVITGQLDPKDLGLLKTPSSTEPSPQEN